MPRQFKEFEIQDLRNISITIEDLFPVLVERPHNVRRDIITDNNGAIALIEYKQAPAIPVVPPDLNNPDYSINIDNNFNVIITGFNPDDEDYIIVTVKRYLRNNKFIS